MKRLFTLLAVLMLTVTASFSVGSWLFQIPKPVNLAATTSSFQGSAKVAFNDKVKSIDVTPEVGICYSEHSKPTYYDFKKKLGSAIQDYSFTIMYLTSGTTYYYRTYVKLLDNVYYSAVNSITTMGEKPRNNVINCHEFVDLGLPSGLLWAKTNIGASFSSDDGDYFAWGETASKSYCDIDSYKWADYNGRYYLTKYDFSDGKTTLDTEDDAATVNWGAPCRMPNSSEFQELYNKCDWLRLENGYLVTGPNGNTIFFPASGLRCGDVINGYRSDGCYWSCSLNLDQMYTALNLCFDRNNSSPTGILLQYIGCTVRPVAYK